MQGSEFENAVLQVGWALLKLKQSEAIQGLYAWCRDIAGVKFPYLKALADQAAGKWVHALVDNSMNTFKNQRRICLPNRLSPFILVNLGSTVVDLTHMQRDVGFENHVKSRLPFVFMINAQMECTLFYILISWMNKKDYQAEFKSFI